MSTPEATVELLPGNSIVENEKVSAACAVKQKLRIPKTEAIRNPKAANRNLADIAWSYSRPVLLASSRFKAAN
jgi:hypothetical protein